MPTFSPASKVFVITGAIGVSVLLAGTLVMQRPSSPLSVANGAALVAPKAVQKTTVNPKISPKVQPFALSDVRLLESPFKDAMELDLKYLLSLEPDRFLHNFRKNAGLEPKAPIYGGWENTGVAGFTLGHYLSACSMAWASTGDVQFKKRVDYIISELALCQNQRADGYVSAIPDGDRIWKEVAAGDIRSQGFDLNGGWVPWYTMHKLYAGLIDSYQIGGNEQAKIVVLKLADWAIAETSKLNQDQFQKMLTCEQGGMNESMAQLYAMTGEKKYLDLSEKFNHHEILDPLSKGDAGILPGKHANTQIPKVIGAAQQFELTGDESDRKIAETFWNHVVHDHSYAIGGNSSGEHFGEPNKLNDRLTNTTCETCNTYNMLKLSKHLFEWNPDAKYMDYAERALYNHILASQNPKTGMMCYYVPLEQGGFKAYSTPTDSFWCCVGTGMENHVKYGESIYFHDDNSLYVNLFIPSQLNWQEKRLTVRQENHFPQQNSTKLTFSAKKPTKLKLKIRYPSWTAGAMVLTVNGKAQKVNAKPGSYVELKRVWKTGDVVNLTLPMKLHEEAMPDNPKRVAMLYGPIVLAAGLGSQDQPKSEIPVFVAGDAPPAQWLKPVVGKPLNFKSQGQGHPQDISFKPFFQMHDQRYSVYFDMFTKAGWEEREAKYRLEEEKRKELEARTVDFMQPGEMQPERDHNLQSEKSSTGEGLGHKFRHAHDGWFSFDLKVYKNAAQNLVLNYWGGETDERLFDVLVDGKLLVTQKLLNNQPGMFFDVSTPLPREMINGKDKITVRLQAKPGSIAGGLFGARIVRQTPDQ